MQVLKQNEDGSAVVELTRAELLVLGACIWVTKEQAFDQAYPRFFPREEQQEDSGMTDEDFSDIGYDLFSGWRQFDIDMG
jgi:hypothetical protein